MKSFPEGRLIPDHIHQALREKFAYVEEDHHGRRRLFLDNSGGSFRLKSAVDAWTQVDPIPDCPERIHDNAQEMIAMIQQGEQDMATLVGARSGSPLIRYTASLCNFEILNIAAEYLEGSNVVTTILEHPSSFDAITEACKKHGKELRVASVDPVTGSIPEEAILEMVDENTAFVNLIYASNITGAILDLHSLVPKLRAKKPGLYVITDSVQHAPHHLIDFDRVGLDACTLAPYKMFGPRGFGVGWVSERFSRLPHYKLSGKPGKEWDVGSPAPALYKAFSEIVRYVEWLGQACGSDLSGDNDFEKGMHVIFLHEKALLHYLLHGDQEQPGLKDIQGVEVHFLDSGIEQKDCILGLSFGDEDPTESTRKYGEHHVTVYERSASSIYSVRMIEALGLKGVVRVSPLHVQTIDEMKRFLHITGELARQ